MVDPVAGSVLIQVNVCTPWMAFALDAATAPAAVAREVDGLITRHPELSPHRRLVVDLLTHKSAGARQDAAAFGALRYEARRGFGCSVASITGWLGGRPPGRSAADEIADSLDRFARPTGIDQVPPQARRIRLPYGDGVRVASARRVPSRHAPGADRALFHTREYHVPLDQPPASLLFVRCMTSDTHGVVELVAEFDAIVADLRLTPPAAGASVRAHVGG